MIRDYRSECTVRPSWSRGLCGDVDPNVDPEDEKDHRTHQYTGLYLEGCARPGTERYDGRGDRDGKDWEDSDP